MTIGDTPARASNPPRGAGRPTLPSIENVLLLALAGVGFVAFLCRAIQALSPTLDLGGLERNVAVGIARLLRGESLYTNPEQPPFAIIQYGPVYYVIVAGICRVLGIGAERVEAIFLC